MLALFYLRSFKYISVGKFDSIIKPIRLDQNPSYLKTEHNEKSFGPFILQTSKSYNWRPI